MDKQIVVHPNNGYYSIIKRNKPLLIHAMTSMNFKKIMVNEGIWDDRLYSV